MSAFKAIQSMVNVCDEKIIDKIISVFKETFASASFNSKENGFLLYATIGLFPNKHILHQLLDKNFDTLLEILNDEN